MFWYAFAVSVLLLPLMASFSPSAPPQSTRYATVLSQERSSVEERLQEQWITCSSSKEMSHAIRKLVRPGDRVAELGSQLREVSTAICETIDSEGHAILVDTLRKFPKDTTTRDSKRRTQAMRLEGDETAFFPDCATFSEIDRLDDWRQAFFPGKSDEVYDVFVLGVNSIVGNDLEWTTLSLIREFLALNGDSCRLVLVKSLSLNQWASRLIHAQRWCGLGGFSQTQFQVDDPWDSKLPCQVVAAVGVPEYRDTIPHTVRAGDAVLEIGCHLGTSTALIHEAASMDGDDGRGKGYCIGIDIGAKIIRGAQTRHSHIYFEEGDAWRTAALLRIQQTFLQQQTSQALINPRTGFDVVYVDVGGLSGQDGIIESLSLISALANALEPRCIVIKSVCMRRLSSTLVPYWKLQRVNNDSL